MPPHSTIHKNNSQSQIRKAKDRYRLGGWGIGNWVDFLQLGGMGGMPLQGCSTPDGNQKVHLRVPFAVASS